MLAKLSDEKSRNTFNVTKEHIDKVDELKSNQTSRTKFVESIFEAILEGKYDDLLEGKPDYDERLTASKTLTSKVNEKLKPKGYDATKAIRMILDQIEIK